MFTYDFLGYDDLMFVALVALILVLRNFWDFARYGYEHGKAPADTPHLTAHPLQLVAALASRARAAALFPHAARTAPRPLMRRRDMSRALEPVRPARA